MIYTVTLNPALDYFMEYSKIKIGEVNRSLSTRVLPGGKGIMESRMLARLGAKNTALGFIGGFSGKFIRDSMEDQGVQTQFTSIFSQTRINVKLKTSLEETSLDATGPELNDEDLKNFLKNFENLKTGDIVAFAGTIPKSLDENFYEQLIQKVKAQGAEFAIDIDGQKLLQTLPYKPILIKPNREELEEIFSVKFQKKEEIIPYGKKMLEMGAQNVIVSLAGDGALLFTEKKVYFAAAVEGIIKNSVGAGDSTVAGFLAEWSQSKSAVDAFKQGVACGTAKVFSEDMPSSRFLQRCYQKIKIEELNDGD